jgi:UDP-glucose 4-epimerase
MRILVTGGAGFIGSQVVRDLRARGDEVVVVDRHPHPDAELVSIAGDIADPDVVAEALAPGTDAVVHLAAMTSVLESKKDPEGVFRTNVVGTSNLLERARNLGTERFVFISSNAVVGDVGTATMDESALLRPLTPYGGTKAAGEMMMSYYGASYDMVAVTLRYTNIYGVGMQRKDSVVARLMRAALAGTSIPIYGDGEQVRDYLYVADASAAVLLALGLERPELFIVGYGASVSMNEIHRMAVEVTGIDIPAEQIPARPGEMPAVIVDTSRARAAGFEPRYDLRRGMAAAWEDFRANPPQV